MVILFESTLWYAQIFADLVMYVLTNSVMASDGLASSSSHYYYHYILRIVNGLVSRLFIPFIHPNSVRYI